MSNFAIPADQVTIDPSSPVPLWAQIESGLATAIRERRITPGQRLPAEQDLARGWGVSRGTVRHGLRRLSERGVLTRTPHHGTRVGTRPDAGLRSLPTFESTVSAARLTIAR